MQTLQRFQPLPKLPQRLALAELGTNLAGARVTQRPGRIGAVRLGAVAADSQQRDLTAPHGAHPGCQDVAPCGLTSRRTSHACRPVTPGAVPGSAPSNVIVVARPGTQPPRPQPPQPGRGGAQQQPHPTQADGAAGERAARRPKPTGATRVPNATDSRPGRQRRAGRPRRRLSPSLPQCCFNELADVTIGAAQQPRVTHSLHEPYLRVLGRPWDRKRAGGTHAASSGVVTR